MPVDEPSEMDHAMPERWSEELPHANRRCLIIREVEARVTRGASPNG
jgi:hypothetical protein